MIIPSKGVSPSGESYHIINGFLRLKLTIGSAQYSNTSWHTVGRLTVPEWMPTYLLNGYGAHSSVVTVGDYYMSATYSHLVPGELEFFILSPLTDYAEFRLKAYSDEEILQRVAQERGPEYSIAAVKLLEEVKLIKSLPMLL